MAQKSFEIQGNALSIGGVELNSSADGKIIVPGISRATGYKLVDIEQVDLFVYSFTAQSQLTIVDNFHFLDITDNGVINNNLGTAGPLAWNFDQQGQFQLSINEESDWIYTESQMLSAMNSNLWLTEVNTPTGQGGWFASTDAEDWYQIPFRPVFEPVSIESDLPNGGGDNITNGLYSLSIASTGPINIPTASTGLGRLQNVDGIEILVNSGNNAKLFTFSDDGTLTLPNNTTVGDDLAGEYSSSFLCLSWGVNDQTSGLFSSNNVTRPFSDPLIATVAVGWFVSGPGLNGVKEITDIVEMGDGDRAFIVDLTDGSLWADLSVQIPYRFYSSDYSLVYNGTRLTVDSNEWNFTQAGDLTIPGNINEKVGNDLEIAVHNNRNNDGTPGSAVLSLTNNDAVDFQTYTTLEVGAYDITLNTDYESVFTGARRTWEFGRNGDLTFPGGTTLRDLPGVTPDDSVLILGAGVTIAENQRAARIGINGSVEGVSIGAGSNDWSFTNDGRLTFPGGMTISTEEGGDTRLIIAGGSNFIDLRSNGTILIGYNSTGSVQIGNPEGGTTTEIVSEKVKFLLQSVPTSSVGAAGDTPGLIAFDISYIYYCTGTYNGVDNIWKRVAWSGDTW